jgi:hypothetical protein
MATVACARRWGACGLGWLVAAAAGCGDALVDTDYRGTPLFTIEGTVIGASDLLNRQTPLNVALFFSPSGPQTTDPAALSEQPGTALMAQLPRSFTLNLFDPPGAAQLVRNPDGSSYAIGKLLAYIDYDGNGRRDGADRVIGGSPQRALLYAPQPLRPEQSPSGLPLQPGFSLVTLPLSCRPSPPPPPPSGKDCSQRLGQPCASDAQCGVGVCLRNFGDLWPQGACALPDPLPAGCAAIGAVRVPDWSGGSTAYWVKSCNADADCQRPPPYQCDMAFRACLPTSLNLVMVADPPPPLAFCR